MLEVKLKAGYTQENFPWTDNFSLSCELQCATNGFKTKEIFLSEENFPVCKRALTTSLENTSSCCYSKDRIECSFRSPFKNGNSVENSPRTINYSHFFTLFFYTGLLLWARSATLKSTHQF